MSVDETPPPDDVPLSEDSPEDGPESGDGRAVGRRGRVLRSEATMAVEVTALVALAVVQPVLGPFGESPETFMSLGVGPAAIVVFAVSLVVVPVVLLTLLAAPTRLAGDGVRRAVHCVVVASLAALIAGFLARQVGAGPAIRVAAAAVVGVGAWFAYRRWEPVRMFLRFAAPMSLVLVVMFLFASPVAPLVRPPAVEVGAAAVDGQAPVLFIVVDELPTTSLMDGDGGVDAELFPNFARLADTSTWYRDHTAVAPTTTQSMPAVVSGLLPPTDAERAPVHGEHPDSIFRVAAATHEVTAAEWFTELCAPSICSGDLPTPDAEAAALLDAPLSERDARSELVETAVSLWWGQVWPVAEPPAMDYAVVGRTAVDDLVRPGLEFLTALDDPAADRPRFDYLHAPVPHQPWLLLPTGRGYDAPHPAPGSEFLGWGDDDKGEQLGAAARSRHLLQLRWTDRLLGAIIDRYEELGLWDDAVVVLTADHGVSFERGHELRTVMADNHVELFWVPLFIKAPGQRAAEVDDGPATMVDIVPTVAELAGIELDWDPDGSSLLGTQRGAAGRPAWFPGDGPAGTIEQLGDEGLDRVLTAGPHFPGGDPALRPWRHGRHGDLLGRSVAELGECPPSAEVEVGAPEDWPSFVRGDLDPTAPLPLWHQVMVTEDRPLDVAAVVGDRVVGWNVTRRDERGVNASILLSEPLLAEVDDDPRFYEVLDGSDGCRLSPLTPVAG